MKFILEEVYKKQLDGYSEKQSRETEFAKNPQLTRMRSYLSR